MRLSMASFGSIRYRKQWKRRRRRLISICCTARRLATFSRRILTRSASCRLAYQALTAQVPNRSRPITIVGAVTWIRILRFMAVFRPCPNGIEEISRLPHYIARLGELDEVKVSPADSGSLALAPCRRGKYHLVQQEKERIPMARGLRIPAPLACTLLAAVPALAWGQRVPRDDSAAVDFFEK